MEAGAEQLLSAEIDNRRRAENMLRERTQLLDTLIQTSPVGIIVHDRSSRGYAGQSSLLRNLWLHRTRVPGSQTGGIDRAAGR